MIDTPKIFIFQNAIDSIKDFEAQAQIALRLQAHGRVLVDVGTLAEKSRYMLPVGGSPWHEYATNAPTLAKFFPHPKIADYLPAGHVRANRSLLEKKVRILARLGLGAAFWCIEPMFLPEAFFGQYPHLRGPRVDHPRRSKAEAFAPCADAEEVLEMYEWMLAQFKHAVPMFESLTLWTDDCGAGFCWADTLYSGPNGHAACATSNMGLRVRRFLESLHRGAQAGGGDIDIHVSGNVSESEREQIALHLPARSFARGFGVSHHANISVHMDEAYPALGVFNPLSVIQSGTAILSPGIQHVFLVCEPSYKRAAYPASSFEKTVDVIDAIIQNPAKGLKGQWSVLEGLCRQWAGEESAERLFEAFIELDRCIQLKSAAAPGLNSQIHRIPLRWVTRPLVIKPDLLSPEEEAYFLPFLFNINEPEGRLDYLDSSGSRLSAGALHFYWGDPRIRSLPGISARIKGVATLLENLPQTPAGSWFRKFAAALRIWCSSLRSGNNFCAAQIIRDRNQAALAAAPHFPNKTPTWMGDEDLQIFYRIMRDELDNAVELMKIMRQGGIDQFARAKEPEDEDCFLAGPDLLGALQKKIDIMRRHWLDIEKYLASPFK